MDVFQQLDRTRSETLVRPVGSAAPTTLTRTGAAVPPDNNCVLDGGFIQVLIQEMFLFSDVIKFSEEVNHQTIITITQFSTILLVLVYDPLCCEWSS